MEGQSVGGGGGVKGDVFHYVPPENGLPSHGGGQEGKVKEADVVM